MVPAWERYSLDYNFVRTQKACDEYFGQNRIPILLNHIDYTGRIALKP